MQAGNKWNDQKPMTGIKVLDLSGVLAGPLTGSFMAELGADVIKIENKLSGGDATRQWKLPSEDQKDPYSAYYHSANYGKKVLLLDLSNPYDYKIAENHLASSDIVISNFQKKTAQKLGFLPNEIVKKYPKIIFAQLSAYDFDDPRPGYDLVMQGETGWISMNGMDTNNVAKLPVAIVDILASHQLKEGILLALWKKSLYNVGTIVHVSLYKSSISALANQATNFLNAGHVAKPIGTLHPNIAPYGDIFKSSDNITFMLAVGSDLQFKKLWFTLINEVPEYSNFEFNTDRVKNRSTLNEILQQQFLRLNFSELEEIIISIQVPYCKILSIDEVFSGEMAQKMILPIETENGKAYSISNIAFELSE